MLNWFVTRPLLNNRTSRLSQHVPRRREGAALLYHAIHALLRTTTSTVKIGM